MKNIFTIDLEDYFHCNLENVENMKKISTIEKNVDTLLKIFHKYNIKATFFVLGSVAEEYPEVVKKVAKAGHEIASHGYAHKLAYFQTKEEFRQDIVKAKKIIEDIIKTPVIGYRAPSWSITEKNKWALEILQEEGFKYSSSIFPTKNFLYGISDAPRTINVPYVGSKKMNIYEIPPSTFKIAGKTIGFSGGSYFRLFPTFFIKYLIKRNNRKGNPVICYLHPWELDPNSPKMKLSFINRNIHYYGIKRCQKKLEKILASFKFTTIDDVYKKNYLDKEY